jgi:hypothetical protein
MGIKTRLTLFVCGALFWSALDVVQPWAGDVPPVDPLDAPPAVLPDEPGVDRGSGATTERPLGHWLDILMRAHGIEILLHPGVSTAAPATVSTDDLSLETGLRLLLHDYDFFLQYGAGEKEATNRVRRVWVFPRYEGDRQQIVPKYMPEAATPPAPRDHGAELREAMERSSEEAHGVLAGALGDEDENVRRDGLQAALQEGLPMSPSLLESVLLHDESEFMRAAAFDALILRSEPEGLDLNAVIDLAVQDPSPLVKSRALALREALGAPVSPPRLDGAPTGE